MVKRTGNRRGRPVARMMTRIKWVKLLSLRASPGGGSDRPCYKDERRQCSDCYPKQQPASQSGFVHLVSSLSTKHYSNTI